LRQYYISVDIFDPVADPDEVLKEYNIELLSAFNDEVYYNAIIIAVAHQKFLELDFKKIKKNNTIIFDTKAFVNRELVDARL
jgi:UDP-N-acetyl-D-glucosamine/UDP-N-acetyl-D-galactosamine dehydrogenase